LVAAARDCDVLIAYRQTPAPASLFAALPRLAAFVRCAMDIRTVDVAAASANGVLVTRASPGFNAAVAEWIIAMMINLGRGIAHLAADYRRREMPVPQMGRELRGATVGIIGYGGIGRCLGELVLGFGAQLLVNTPQPVTAHERLAQVPLNSLLANSDFVVCLAPALPETAGLLNVAAFAAMKPDAYFINASRGELIDEDALLAALDSGRIAGCALDVGMAPDQTPSPALARHPRVLATPHIGGLTTPAIEHQALETVQQLRSLLQGQLPVGAVNAEHATRWQRLAQPAA
jgi:D-3-phosphoglycerate dehydrogenase